MTIDIPLATKIMNHIVAHPDEHSQADWIATGDYLRATVGMRLDQEFIRDRGRFPTAKEYGELEAQVPLRTPDCGTAACFAGHAVLMSGMDFDDKVDAVVTNEDGKVLYRSVRVVATELLGLDGTQANRLFKADNTIDDLWEILADYSDGAITKPEAG